MRSAHETLDRDEAGQHVFLGYLSNLDECRIWHSGDCVPFPGLIEEVANLKPHIALLPVNGRSMKLRESGAPGNFTVEEAIKIARQVGASSLIAHHFGMFSFNRIDPTEIDRLAETTLDLQIIRAKIETGYIAAGHRTMALRQTNSFATNSVIKLQKQAV
jgi:L-ascorbate metabolism protein UlaG (beta-lactamase superfamily)